jgi:hypothetical protein
MEYLISPVLQKEFCPLRGSCYFLANSACSLKWTYLFGVFFYSAACLLQSEKPGSVTALFIDLRVILPTCFTSAPGYYLKMRLLKTYLWTLK